LAFLDYRRMEGGPKFLLLLIAAAALSEPLVVAAARCDREPEGRMAAKSPADGRFRIKVSGNPDKYVPGEVYTGECYI
jgi:hypothetical protein